MKGSDSLKDPAELEKDFAVAGVAIASTNQNRTKGGFKQEADGCIGR